jgi:hypothetical protein
MRLSNHIQGAARKVSSPPIKLRELSCDVWTMCRSTILAIFALAVFFLTAAVSAFAQVALSKRPNLVGPPTGLADEVAGLRDLADEFAEKLANHRADSVLVIDFEERSPEGLGGWPEPKGARLADQFSNALWKSDPRLTVLDRRHYRRTL